MFNCIIFSSALMHRSPCRRNMDKGVQKCGHYAVIYYTLFNLSYVCILQLSGIGVLGVGIWLMVEKNVVNMQ